MTKRLAVLLTLGMLIGAETPDSTAVASPKKAAMYGFMIPGGGQFYNRKYLKAGVILSCEILAAWRYSENRNAYNNYDPSDSESQHRYLEKRNKYAWWIAFIYLYGVIDAVVDAHLQPFDDIMNEDLEGVNQEPHKSEEES